MRTHGLRRHGINHLLSYLRDSNINNTVAYWYISRCIQVFFKSVNRRARFAGRISEVPILLRCPKSCTKNIPILVNAWCNAVLYQGGAYFIPIKHFGMPCRNKDVQSPDALTNQGRGLVEHESYPVTDSLDDRFMAPSQHLRQA